MSDRIGVSGYLLFEMHDFVKAFLSRICGMPGFPSTNSVQERGLQLKIMSTVDKQITIANTCAYSINL